MNNDLEQQVSIMETSMEDLISFVEEAQAEKDRQLEAIAKQIEGKFTQDCSRRARKEREWILSERLLMGSTFRFLKEHQYRHAIHVGANVKQGWVRFRVF